MEENDKPGTSGDNTIRSRKGQKSRRPLSVAEKQMVANIYKYIYDEAAKDPTELKPKVNECVEKTAFVLKLSRGTIYSVLKEGKEGGFTAPKKAGPKRDFRDKLSEETFHNIRKRVEDLIRENKVPATMNNIHKATNDDPDLPNFSKSTLYEILKHLGIVPAILSRKGVPLGKRQKNNEVQAEPALQLVDVKKEIKIEIEVIENND